MIFVENKNTDPALNHAIELYLMENYDDDIFMLWRNRPCILIGRYQNINLEVNLDFTNENNMDVIRRLSGGGAIYCDTDNMQYSFITKKTGSDVDSSFKKFAGPVVSALKSLGLDAEFTGRNDIQIGGAKVSGNAQFQSKEKILHHGTLLFKANLYNLTNSLKARDIKFKGKAVQSIRSRVGFIGDMIDMDIESFMDYVVEFMKKEYRITNTTVLTDDEMKKIHKIREEIFSAKEWNEGTMTLKKNRNAQKYSCGVVEIGLDIESEKIKDISIEGDFFSELGIDKLSEVLIGVDCTKEAVEKALKDIDLDRYIRGMDKTVFIEDIIKLF
ncbi:MAG: lipoate--protein ligase [Peptoniphilaceae bacterium]|uniref:lipoate--protein ligase n=1 Tax=Parvimonas sp. TaxID=1944660 RepID=UPI0025EECCD6|nr:lipoate--protein ligase [Parvimonas sp.]MCI5997928.1 lipoate--protein ligase [Parvimonas sp.]MDD7764229.1 lipoate--protein ligase [Peptoniphilaceae bacterium]MDY3050435.1 lipoate--protein ligase [Parvimonas sp.]